MTIGYVQINLGPGEGKLISAMGVEMVYKAVGDQNGGSFFCMEYKAPPGWAGPPSLVHGKTEEAPAAVVALDCFQNQVAGKLQDP